MCSPAASPPGDCFVMPWILVAGLADDSLSLGGAESETSVWRRAGADDTSAADLLSPSTRGWSAGEPG